METYRVRVRPTGAFGWQSKQVALHDPGSVLEVIAAAKQVLGRAARSGDEIEVTGSKGVVTPKFTVP